MTEINLYDHRIRIRTSYIESTLIAASVLLSASCDNPQQGKDYSGNRRQIPDSVRVVKQDIVIKDSPGAAVNVVGVVGGNNEQRATTGSAANPQHETKQPLHYQVQSTTKYPPANIDQVISGFGDLNLGFSNDEFIYVTGIGVSENSGKITIGSNYDPARVLLPKKADYPINIHTKGNITGKFATFGTIITEHGDLSLYLYSPVILKVSSIKKSKDYFNVDIKNLDCNGIVGCFDYRPGDETPVGHLDVSAQNGKIYVQYIRNKK